MNYLSLPLAVAFLFFVGATSGWLLEFAFRNLVSHKGPKGRYFINPGFCKGPWLPIYGVGIAVCCTISEIVYSYFDETFVESAWGKVVIILIMGLVMNCIEFTGGLILLKGFHMRLWDYRDRKWNFMGIVCPLFALIWTLISAGYYLFIHRISLYYLSWFSKNLAFAFFVGLFWGFFILDMWSGFNDAGMVKKLADEMGVIIHYDDLKSLVQVKLMNANKKQHFFGQILYKGVSLENLLEGYIESMEDKIERLKKRK
ncbi:MAG: putative ABC transporter permease [Lachnospiraceae bacterium]|nr:putative ABC transporter permease [Candidatus Colinaster scatohippi]